MWVEEWRSDKEKGEEDQMEGRNQRGGVRLVDKLGKLYPGEVPVDKLRMIEDLGGEQRWEVKKIHEHRGSEEQREYLVQWKGSSERTWESANNFDEHQCIRDYWEARRRATRRQEVAGTEGEFVFQQQAVETPTVVHPVMSRTSSRGRAIRPSRRLDD
jgi:Chromo (CHRromatin Organisation MOdifier) domain